MQNKKGRPLSFPAAISQPFCYLKQLQPSHHGHPDLVWLPQHNTIHCDVHASQQHRSPFYVVNFCPPRGAGVAERAAPLTFKTISYGYHWPVCKTVRSLYKLWYMLLGFV